MVSFHLPPYLKFSHCECSRERERKRERQTEFQCKEKTNQSRVHGSVALFRRLCLSPAKEVSTIVWLNLEEPNQAQSLSLSTPAVAHNLHKASLKST
ncbi:hypothetical protein NL676_024169 [Syzygium grande]|nr:hypothetical protein NL676_024169 [Syzygium grande]